MTIAVFLLSQDHDLGTWQSTTVVHLQWLQCPRSHNCHLQSSHWLLTSKVNREAGRKVTNGNHVMFCVTKAVICINHCGKKDDKIGCGHLMPHLITLKFLT